MPDAGVFDREREQRRVNGWGNVFAALPQDTPDPDGWQRVQARLPAPVARARARWPLWLATAASLALATLIPLRILPQMEPGATAPPQRVSTTAAPSVMAAMPSSAASEMQPVSTPVASRDTPRRAIHSTPSQRPIRTVAEAADAVRIAEAPVPSDLEPLYAQSAQLESLLAMARDERVASGTSAALSDELDQQVAAIDTTLTEAGLSDVQRAELWGQRVDALRQLVGIEATNRLYAARGQPYDAALVSID